MNDTQILTVVLATVPTMATVLIGILINNSRMNDLRSDMNVRLGAVEARLTNLENKFDTRFDLLLSKVVDLDNRLTRIEAQGR
ncbi:MAG: hypothetical protein ABI165_07455 [Bryobacteraceae bacterium]